MTKSEWGKYFKWYYEVPSRKEEKMSYSKSGRWWRLLQARLRHGKSGK